MSKQEFSGKIRLCQFLDQTGKNFKKNIRKNNQRLLKTCWTDWPNVWEMNGQQWFHRKLCLWRQIYKGTMTISYLLDILMIILKYFGNFQSFQIKSNQFASLMTHLWDIRLPWIIQSNQSRAPWTITQNCNIVRYRTWNGK